MQHNRTDEDGLSRESFSRSQWQLFKRLVLTAERLIAEDQPHDQIADVLRQTAKSSQEFPILRTNPGSYRLRPIYKIKQIVARAV